MRNNKVHIAPSAKAVVVSCGRFNTNCLSSNYAPLANTDSRCTPLGSRFRCVWTRWNESYCPPALRFRLAIPRTPLPPCSWQFPYKCVVYAALTLFQLLPFWPDSSDHDHRPRRQNHVHAPHRGSHPAHTQQNTAASIVRQSLNLSAKLLVGRHVTAYFSNHQKDIVNLQTFATIVSADFSNATLHSQLCHRRKHSNSASQCKYCEAENWCAFYGDGVGWTKSLVIGLSRWFSVAAPSLLVWNHSKFIVLQMVEEDLRAAELMPLS